MSWSAGGTRALPPIGQAVRLPHRLSTAPWLPPLLSSSPKCVYSALHSSSKRDHAHTHARLGSSAGLVLKEKLKSKQRLDLWYFKAGAFEWIMMRSPRALVAMAELGVARDQFSCAPPPLKLKQRSSWPAQRKLTCVAFQTHTVDPSRGLGKIGMILFFSDTKFPSGRVQCLIRDVHLENRSQEGRRAPTSSRAPTCLSKALSALRGVPGSGQTARPKDGTTARQ